MKEEIKKLVEEAEARARIEIAGPGDVLALCAAIREMNVLARENDKRARHAEQERDAFDKRIDELTVQLQEAADLAAHYGALANEREKKIATLEADNERLVGEVLDLQGETPWKNRQSDRS